MPKTVIVASTAHSAGKSGVCIALVRELQERGVDVGYFKPYGTMPDSSDGLTTDLDAAYINELLRPPGPRDSVCAVVRTRAFIEDTLAGRTPDLLPGVHSAFEAASRERAFMVVEGPSDLSQGACAGLSICEVADELGAGVLLVDRAAGLSLPDPVLNARVCLGDRLRGVVFNNVRASDRGAILDHVAPFLEARGVRVFGTLEHDPLLSSVTVGEVVEAVGGTILCAEERLDEPVESFMVGAMGQEKALRFFRRKSRKAVITGGDRADVQLAALETSTSVIVLTGNVPPASMVLARADELGVPMVMVDMDTLSAVERLESIMGRVRLHGPGKADRIREIFTRGVAVDDLLAAFGEG